MCSNWYVNDTFTGSLAIFYLKMFLIIYKDTKLKVKGDIMLGKILFGVIKKSTRRLPIKTFGRTIASKGNGQRRFIVEGFSGRNIEPSSHFMRLARLNQANQRPVIKGFNPHYNEFQGTIVKPMPSKINRGGVKFFPNFSTTRITRHIVHDNQKNRIKVSGFRPNDTNTQTVQQNTSIQLQAKDDLKAKERIVVQGFRGDASKPLFKQLDTSNATPRAVVKGFLG